MNAGRTLRICMLYPSRMNIYADRGNILLLEQRCRARGIGFEQHAAETGERITAAEHDLFYIGGGQDRDQREISSDLRELKKPALAEGTAAGKVLLAVCGGYQLLGERYQIGSERIAGLGLVELETVREDGPRLTGNVLVETGLGSGDGLLAGFENHAGRTTLGSSAEPLGRVRHGHGNNGRDGSEGVIRDNIFGTYLHGPLLPKNVWFADLLIERALGLEGLSELDDELERAAHQNAVEAAGGR